MSRDIGVLAATATRLGGAKNPRTPKPRRVVAPRRSSGTRGAACPAPYDQSSQQRRASARKEGTYAEIGGYYGRAGERSRSNTMLMFTRPCGWYGRDILSTLANATAFQKGRYRASFRLSKTERCSVFYRNVAAYPLNAVAEYILHPSILRPAFFFAFPKCGLPTIRNRSPQQRRRDARFRDNTVHCDIEYRRTGGRRGSEKSQQHCAVD